MIKFLLSLSLLIFVADIKAQQTLSKIPLSTIAKPGAKLDIQALSLNDSILIVSNSFNPNDLSKAFWISPTGKLSDLIKADFKNKLIVGITNSGDSTYFYYLEKSNQNIILSALVQSRISGGTVTSTNKIRFIGEFISLFMEGKKLYLLSIQNEKNGIHLIELDKMNTVTEKVFISPANLSANQAPFIFVPEKSTVSPREAKSPNKIFQEGNLLYVVIDKDGSSSKTSILKLDLTSGELENNSIDDSLKKGYQTYIGNNYFFKITKDRSSGCRINIFDLQDSHPIQSINIDKHSEIATNKAIKRGYMDTYYKETVWDAIANNGDGFITVSSLDSDHFIFKVGSHHIQKQSTGPNVPVIFAFPVLGLFGAIARFATFKLEEVGSIDHYFYLIWDRRTTPRFDFNNFSTIDQIIDNYEIEQWKMKTKFQYKDYVSARTKTIGIYLETGSDVIDIISFKKP